MKIMDSSNKLKLGIVLFLLGSLAFAFYLVTRSPSSEQIKARLDGKREVFEELRDSMNNENSIVGVESSGVFIEGRNSILERSSKDFPVVKYDEYIRLMHEIGVEQISKLRSGEGVCFGSFSGGFAGGARHVMLCWIPKKDAPIFKMKYRYHIDSLDTSWYVFRDD